MLVHAPAIRLGAFIAVLAVMAVWEVAAPRRRKTFSRFRRWPSNLAVVALNTALVRLLLPTSTVGLALVAEKRGLGLLTNLPIPSWLTLIGSVVLLDLVIYLQHVMFHAVPAL